MRAARTCCEPPFFFIESITICKQHYLCCCRSSNAKNDSWSASNRACSDASSSSVLLRRPGHLEGQQATSLYKGFETVVYFKNNLVNRAEMPSLAGGLTAVTLVLSLSKGTVGAGSCGTSVFSQTFSQYPGNYRAWSQQEAIMDFKSDAPSRKSGTGVLLAPGLGHGFGFENVMVGEGQMKLKFPKGRPPVDALHATSFVTSTHRSHHMNV